MYEYLDDKDFLTKLDKLHLRTQYAKITLLTFDEKPLREIQGNITAGSLNVDGSSSVRRTISLTMLANEEVSGIEDVDNAISINKKVKVSVGYKNPYPAYASYGDIIWFPCGLFVLTSANTSRSTSGWTISISGKDKMCMLDGTVGGTLPASTTFNEVYIYDDEGNVEDIEYPTIYWIIQEAVVHWGGEALENIVISGIDEECKMLVRYMGNKTLYFSDNYESFSFSPDDDFPHVVKYGEDAGYEKTDFTYPGDLTLAAGDTVTSLLDKIVSTLGNYEYFYDIWGVFHFQEIENYLNTTTDLAEMATEDYLKNYTSEQYVYSLTSLDGVTAININPSFDNIKNDFYVWGQRTSAAGTDIPIRYHLAIDTKPEIDLAAKYMWKVYEEVDDELVTVRYEFNDISDNFQPAEARYKALLVSPPARIIKDGKTSVEADWREELYRKALNAQITNGINDNYYDTELISEWRKLYDPGKATWDEYNHWNPDVQNNPEVLDFWLDYIDDASEIGKYSINEIGRRTKVINDTDITSIYSREVPDIYFINGYNQEEINDCVRQGQQYFILNDQYYSMFSISSTGASCFDSIREMLYQNLNYNTSITITCFPRYYMEPNNIIHIEDAKSHVNGNYEITKFSLPLAYNGTMSITATEVLTRV